jgi:hypothetical protein
MGWFRRTNRAANITLIRPDRSERMSLLAQADGPDEQGLIDGFVPRRRFLGTNRQVAAHPFANCAARPS